MSKAKENLKRQAPKRLKLKPKRKMERMNLNCWEITKRKRLTINRPIQYQKKPKKRRKSSHLRRDIPKTLNLPRFSTPKMNPNKT